MKDTKLWVLVVGVLLIVAVSAYFLISAVVSMTQDVSEAANRAVQPVDDVAEMTGSLATQMAL